LLTATLRNLPTVDIFSTFAGLPSGVVRVAGGVMTMVAADLQTKVEKYESRASRCEEQARGATDKAQQAFYEVLAGYYNSLATDFRQIIEKRKVA
jgi:translation elongation factor EF-Tu-like GTPase